MCQKIRKITLAVFGHGTNISQSLILLTLGAGPPSIAAKIWMISIEDEGTY